MKGRLEAPERAGTSNGVPQRVAEFGVADLVAEATHHVAHAKFESVRQLKKVRRGARLARLRPRLRLPPSGPLRRLFFLLDIKEVAHDADDLPRLAMDVRRDHVVRTFDRLDDVVQRHDRFGCRFRHAAAPGSRMIVAAFAEGSGTQLSTDRPVPILPHAQRERRHELFVDSAAVRDPVDPRSITDPGSR
jgi:hypothetical protein